MIRLVVFFEECSDQKPQYAARSKMYGWLLQLLHCQHDGNIGSLSVANTYFFGNEAPREVFAF